MVDRAQGRKPDSNEDEDEDKRVREPRPSDRERDPPTRELKDRGREVPEDDDDEERDPGAGVVERDPGDEGDGEQQLTDEEIEAKRERRRQEKREKRDRERREKEELRRTVRELRDELTNVKQRVENSDRDGRLVRLDDDIDETKSIIGRLRQLKRQAIEAVDPDKIEDIDDKLYRARRRLEDLEATKAQASKRTTERAVDPNLIRHANNFMRDHAWYDARANTDDEDSARVQAIDRRLMREGRFEPGSAEYWDELRQRVRKQLPHKFGRKPAASEDDDADDPPPRRGGPPVSGRGERGAPGTGQGFILTEDHKSALREAGIEPGTERYSKMIERFKEADKAQRQKRAQAA